LLNIFKFGEERGQVNNRNEDWRCNSVLNFILSEKILILNEATVAGTKSWNFNTFFRGTNFNP
jgi:hypothetical protein